MITSLGEERANLSAFRTFVQFALVWFCLFPLPLGVWEGLQFAVFSYLSFFDCGTPWTFLLRFLEQMTDIPTRDKNTLGLILAS